MGSTAKRIIGGLLTGGGEGMLEQARSRRKETLLKLQQSDQNARDERRETRADERADKSHQQSRGLLTGVFPDAEGNMQAVTRGGDTKPLGFKSGRKSDQATSGRSADDQRLINEAKERNTTQEGIDDPVIDWKGVDAYLAAKGRPDLAAPRALPGDTSIDKNSEEWLSAQEDAEKWAKDQERFWSFDTTVFEPYGGETQAIRNKAMEYYLADKGVVANKSNTSGATKPDTSATSMVPGAPPGSGTESDPYRATTQQQVDWFKSSATAGTIIEVDGTLYRK